MAKYTVSKTEKETIILFNEEDDNAEIYTYNRKLISKLKKHPTFVKLKEKDDAGAYTFVVPKDRMSIGIRKPLSEEQKSQLIERGKQMQRKKKGYTPENEIKI